MITRVCASSAPERFVQRQDSGSGDERTNDTDALFHAAGEVVRVFVPMAQRISLRKTSSTS